MDNAEAYSEVSHAEMLSNRQQQLFIKNYVEDSFWLLIEPDIRKETNVWPPADLEVQNGTSVMELLLIQH